MDIRLISPALNDFDMELESDENKLGEKDQFDERSMDQKKIPERKFSLFLCIQQIHEQTLEKSIQ